MRRRKEGGGGGGGGGGGRNHVSGEVIGKQRGPPFIHSIYE